MGYPVKRTAQWMSETTIFTLYEGLRTSHSPLTLVRFLGVKQSAILKVIMSDTGQLIHSLHCVISTAESVDILWMKIISLIT